MLLVLEVLDLLQVLGYLLTDVVLQVIDFFLEFPNLLGLLVIYVLILRDSILIDRKVLLKSAVFFVDLLARVLHVVKLLLVNV